MIGAPMTVNTGTAQPVPVTQASGLVNGLRMLSRTTTTNPGNTGNVYFGFSANVTTATGILVSQGLPGASIMTTVPAHHFTQPEGGGVWVVADTNGQVMDWSAD